MVSPSRSFRINEVEPLAGCYATFGSFNPPIQKPRAGYSRED